MCQFETLAGHFGLASDFSDNIFVFFEIYFILCFLWRKVRIRVLRVARDGKFMADKMWFIDATNGLINITGNPKSGLTIMRCRFVDTYLLLLLLFRQVGQ